jgi:hypothetical protein
MNLNSVLTMLLLLVSIPSGLAQKSPFSGPQPGERIEPFKVLVVNGPEAGKEVDYLSDYGEAPVLLIFLHQLDRNVAAMLRPCERFAQDRASAGLKTLIVYLAPDKIEGERRMRAVVKSLNIQVPVGVALEGVEGPGAYGLNREVAVTALVAKERKVTANFAIIQPGTVDAPRVMTAVASHVGGRVPTAEEIQAELVATSGRATVEVRAMSGKAEPDPPELANMLRSLIQRSNTPERVDQVVGELRTWAGSDTKRRSAIAQKMTVIIPLKYGTEYAQTQMAVLQTEMGK